MKVIKQGSIILIASSFLSALLGVLRDRLLAGHFGASPELDVYFAAFRIPDFVYNVIIGGGILVAFLPVFAQEYQKGSQKAWRLTNNVLNTLFIFLVAICFFLFLLTPALIQLIVPGFSSSQKETAVVLTRILFLSPIIFGISNLFSGIVNYFHRFLAYGLGPIFYNLGIIGGIIFLAPKFGISGVVLGVILGALLHLAVKIPSIYQCGFRYKLLVDFNEKQLRKIFRLMTPRVLSAGVSQINLIIMTALASFLGMGAISVFNFANNLQAMPQKIIALSIATVAFPGLAQNFVRERKEKFLNIFWYSFTRIIFLVGPLALILFLFSEPIVKFILMTGKFSLASAQLTAGLLKIFSISIVFNSLYFLVVRVFFALEDTKTPTLITFLSVILNLLLALLFINYLFVGEKRIFGLGLAFTISSIFEFSTLFLILKRKIKIFEKKN